MVQSQNSSVEYSEPASSFNGLPTQGKVLLGNKAFEYYNEKNPKDFIQIPWDSIDHVAASVVGKSHITRFAIFTTDGAHYSFSTKDCKACLRAVREHVSAERLQRSPDFLDVARAGVTAIPKAVGSLISKDEH